MAATRHQREAVLPASLHDCGHWQQAVERHQAEEDGQEPGQDAAAVSPSPGPLSRGRTSPIATMTGSSIATRISLTTVAVSPASGEMA